MNSFWENIAKDNEAWRNLPSSYEIIFHSSGSSGIPKTIVHTKATLEASARGTLDFYQLKKWDRWGLTLPLEHVSGAMVLVRSILQGSDAPIAKLDRELDKYIISEHFSCLSLVSTQLYRLLLKPSPMLIKKLQKMKLILLGGGSFAPELLEKCKQLNLPCSLTYGMTETASQIVATKINDVFGYRHLLPGRQIKIINDEIYVAGTCLATNLNTDAENYFATGDCGKITEDQGLVIFGRKDQMLISGGENIYPDKIENIFKSIPGVADAIVVGKDHPEWGQAICIILKVTDHLDSAALKNVKKILRPYEWPKHFYQLNPDQWQKLFNNFKVSRNKAKEYVIQNTPSNIR